jgi:hypothetical protein
MVLVAGGNSWDTFQSVYFSSAELYDPVAGTWAMANSMSTLRAFHCAVSLPNGNVLVVGGTPGSTNTLSGAEIYDPDTGSWTATGPMKTGRGAFSATLLSNGKVLVAGGQDAAGAIFSTVELYDPAPGIATPITLANPARLASGAFQFAFTNTSGVGFSVLAATNLALPLSNWDALGSVTEVSQNHFQFMDLQATNSPQRFYQVQSE